MMLKKLKLILLPLFAFSLFVNSSKDTNNIKKASASEEINFVVENKIGKVYENYVIENMHDKNDDTICWLDVSLHKESKKENIPGTLEYIFSSPIIIKNIYFNSGKDDGNGLSDFANGTISYKNENDQYIDLFTVKGFILVGYQVLIGIMIGLITQFISQIFIHFVNADILQSFQVIKKLFPCYRKVKLSSGY